MSSCMPRLSTRASAYTETFPDVPSNTDSPWALEYDNIIPLQWAKGTLEKESHGWSRCGLRTWGSLRPWSARQRGPRPKQRDSAFTQHTSRAMKHRRASTARQGVDDTELYVERVASGVCCGAGKAARKKEAATTFHDGHGAHTQTMTVSPPETHFINCSQETAR